ncbi:hypothetical protein [Legionella brunensis]|uniref:HEPN domain protein n=1 Tax=Legionella brunensis TaxID=29422 RepID=A0A0W0SPD0_9GAMM|nr:hypothetical protein [Legionella brunensis]KTC85069.1 hypothetical protein Lbru_1284 [Legionella brunensis]
MKNESDDFNVITCFLNSALALQISSLEGMRLYFDGESINKSWVEKLIMSFFLYRQGFEVSLIALYKEKTGQEFTGHNLKQLWDTNFIDKDVLRKKIDLAIKVLDNFEALEDIQLFQYHGKPCIEDLPLINNEDLEILSAAGWALHEELLKNFNKLKINSNTSAKILEFKRTQKN